MAADANSTWFHVAPGSYMQLLGENEVFFRTPGKTKSANRRNGVVIRASASQSVDLGFIP